jgi:predicted ATPase
VLGKIINSKANLHLLVVHTRRLEYAPPWLIVTKLHLKPLSVGNIYRLIQALVGAELLPEGLARLVTEKAEGNPLFAEEIIKFLPERGILRTVAGKLDFNPDVMAEPFPGSVQGVLMARVDRLAPRDRALMQAASVIGRQFDPLLLADVVGETDIADRLAEMRALNLVLQKSKSENFVFRHALVQYALYQSLLTKAQKSLHSKIAQQIEQRSSNRLTEVAEALAHHYCRTDSADKAFSYLCMAGTKSLSVYSLDAASSHFTTAYALLDKMPDCASDDQVAEFLLSYARLLSLSAQIETLISVLKRHLGRVRALGDDPRVVLILHHFVSALYWNAQYREMSAIQRQASAMANRLGDDRSKAYALTDEIAVSTILEPKELNEFETLKREALKAAFDLEDTYIQNWTMFAVAWEEFHRGRMKESQNAALELMRIGRSLNDPRSIGMGLALLTWSALVSDSYREALEYSEEASTCHSRSF